MASELKLDDKLQSEIDTLKSMFDENEITINRKDNMMVIDYITSLLKNNKKKKIKIIFAFNITKIASSIIITVKRKSKNKSPLSSEITDSITSKLITQFKQEIDNMPIYQCINYFNNEIKQNKLLFNSPKTQSESKTKEINKKPIAVKEEKNNAIEEKEMDEYIAFIRFNHLLHGKQHKKENEMLSELKNLKHCSASFFGYYFYGRPGIICICCTKNEIKTYAKTCNNIGKKACISYVKNIKELKINIAKNTIKTIFSNNNEKLDLNELDKLLNSLQIKDVKKVLSAILTGGESDFNEIGNGNDLKERQIYFEGYKYDFQIEMATIAGSNGISNGNLYLSIFGENESVLVEKYKFEIKIRDKKRNKKTNNIEFNFEFNDYWFLSQIGNLSKVYLEYDSDKLWQCEWIKIYVYQMFMGKGKKSAKSKPVLKREYQAKMKKYVQKNTPRYLDLSYQY